MEFVFIILLPTPSATFRDEKPAWTGAHESIRAEIYTYPSAGHSHHFSRYWNAVIWFQKTKVDDDTTGYSLKKYVGMREAPVLILVRCCQERRM